MSETTTLRKTVDRTTPDYDAMADSILKIAAELRQKAETMGNTVQLEQAQRLEQIARRISEGDETAGAP